MEFLFATGSMPPIEIVTRLGLAAVGGMLLGLDRELRGLSAGIRTHAMVSLSSAVITVSAFMIYADVRAAGEVHNVDPLRVVQGLAQAIGFIAAGTIFVSRGDVHNLTSAANVWLAAALGIATGAGQFLLALMGLALGIVIISVVRAVERFIPGSTKARGD